MSYSGARGSSHYPAPEGSTLSRIDAVYADPRWVKGVTAGYMMGPDKMQDRKGHCPMMVTVDVKVGEPGDDEEDEQGSDEEGVRLPPKVKWSEEGNERWQQWLQQVHIKMRRGHHVHQAMRSAARVCGFHRQEGEAQAQPKLQRLVATLRKRQHEEVEARAEVEGAEWQAEVAQAKKRVRAARRAVEEEHERIYQKVVAEHERYMEGVVPYESLRYIRELAEAEKPQEIQAVRLQDGRVRGNKQGGVGGSGTKLLEAAQSGAAGAQQDRAENSKGVAESVHSGAERGHTPQQGDAGVNKGGSAGSQEEKEPGSGPAGGGGIPASGGAGAGRSGGEGHGGVAHRRAPSAIGGARCGPCIRKGITSGRGTGGPYAVP